MSNHLPRQTFSSSSTLPSTASRSNNYSGNESNSSSRISTGGPIIFSAGSCLRLPTTTENKKASTLYISEKEAMTWTPYPKYDDFTIGEETKQRLLESVKGSSILSIISPPGCPDLVPRSFASVEDEKHVRSQRNVPLEMLQTEMSLEDYLKDVKIDYSKVFKQCNRPPKNRAIWCNKVWAFDKVENDLEYFEVINNKFNAMVISHSTQMAPVVDRQNLPRSSSRISVLVHHRAGLQLSTRRNILDSNELVATGKELDGRLGSMQRNVAEPLKTASKTRKRDVPIVAVSPDKEANRKAPPKKKRNVSPSLNVPPAAVVVSSNGSRITKATPIPLPFSTPASNTRSHKRVLNAPSSSAVTTMIPRTNALTIAPPPLAALKPCSTVSETTSRANVSTIHPKPAPSNNRSPSQATCMSPAPGSPSRQRSPPPANTGFRQAAVQQLIQAPPPSAENINERPKRLRKPKKPFEF
uniref:Uncharacterized protein n=1 Tax=Panagrolaimus sp. PS1159 TaxID=55785 RepID=A0AC35FKT5_9BILA